MRNLLKLVVIFATINAFGGFSITAENDALVPIRGSGGMSDDDYSHGTQLEWSYAPTDWIHPQEFRRAFGVYQAMYTPKDVETMIPDQDERPWCGTLVFYAESAIYGRSLLNHQYRETYVTRIGIGVLGPSARSEDSQRVVHKALGCTEPLGWAEQFADEPMINIDHMRYMHLWRSHPVNGFSAAFDYVYGGVAGTTFLIGRTGAAAKFGYNVPRAATVPGIHTTDYRTEPMYAYLFTSGLGCLQLHNATLGDSIIRNRYGADYRDLEPVYAEADCGIATGWHGFELSFSVNWRTSEFEDNSASDTAWGVIRLGFGTVL